MATRDNYERCSFESVQCPFTSMSITSGSRMSTHEYRWIKGGVDEDHGRTLYDFSVDAVFHDDKRFSPPLFPDALDSLRGHFNARTVGVLVVPHIGRVKCRIKDWSETLDGGNRSGATAKIVFREHETNRFINATATKVSASSYQNSLDSWALAAENLRRDFELSLIPESDADLFDQITAAANSVLAFRDQGSLVGELIGSKIQSLVNLFYEAESTVSFNNPMNYDAIFAMKDLWAATVGLIESPATGSSEPRVYTTERTMSVMDIADRVHGSTEYANEILGLNNFQDAMAVPAGTRVIYLPISE